ncbi:efflux RND transporter permease subunit [Fredinandcohnia sp. 179-A 10B2 NHS]|uniref:efflux RND transporter permease subunit n=1 Tax=Fredinandcohnia sp. 179-A 10B2 NHS TaxID=3235176 RepID=UPI0039A1587B
MTWFTKWSFKNKAAVTLTTILVLVMGVVSYFTLPMEFLPSADNPQITVIVMGQGTDAETMTDTITSPIEKAVTSVKGKSGIFSTTGDGFSKVDLFFEAGTDMKQAKLDVQEALAGVQLPEGTNKPIVSQLNTDMIPIADISMTFEDGITEENITLAQEKILPALQDIDGVANVAMFGRAGNEISIELDQEKLQQAGLPAQAVLGALQGQNIAAAVGQKTIDGKASNIKVVSTLEGLDDIKALPVVPGVKLEDIATVELIEPQENITRIDGEDALLASVVKDSNSSAVSIANEVKKVSKELSEKYDANVSVFYSTADMIVTSVNTMIKEVLLGALFATIVIMLFLRNLRSTFITIVSIPLSLGFTLFLLKQSGITLNILTIGGVAVAVGRLVDDSIVVIENIFRKMQTEKFSIQLVIDATKEVASAITSSTLTTVAVFLPLGLVGAGLKDFLLPFALTVTYSLLSSLLVALTVVPLMSAGLLRKAKLPQHRTPKGYVKMLRWSLNHKWVVILTSFLLFVGSIGAYFVMPKGALDNSDAELVMVSLDYPNETPLEEVRENTTKLESFLLDQDEIKSMYTQLGNSADAAQFGTIESPTKANFTILMNEGADAEGFIEKVNQQKEAYPNAELVAGAAALLSAGGGSSITIDIVGDQIADIEETATNVMNEIKDIDGIEKVETNQEEKKPVYTFTVDSEVANPGEVTQQLGMLLNRMPIGNVSIDGSNTTVFLEASITPESTNDLEEIKVVSGENLVSITDVAELTVENQSTQVLHMDGETYIRVMAEVDPAKLSVVAAEITKVVKGVKPGEGMKLPDNVEVLIGGASVQQADDFTDLFITMAASIGIVYLIMVITFKTMRAPLAILFSLPLAAIGAVLGLLISRIPVEITALLGALMLIGIVVTNAIVLIDRVKQNEEKMIIRDAILDAAATRLRPILMTAIATICAMLPLLFKKAEMGSLVSQSLAIVVIGGLAVSTLLTLIVVPVIYELFFFKKSKKQRLAEQTSKQQIAG